MDYDLNYQIQILYDYVYNPNKENNYNYNKISLGSIDINDIKVGLDNDDNNIITIYRIMIINTSKQR